MRRNSLRINSVKIGSEERSVGQALKEKALDYFEFIDFEPCTEIASRAVDRLNRIFSESPSDSTATASVRKTSQGFEGQLSVKSASGTFMANVIGEDPLKVIDLLSRKVRSQLRLWKRVRWL